MRRVEVHLFVNAMSDHAQGCARILGPVPFNDRWSPPVFYAVDAQSINPAG
jgi:hypothetical protein